MYIASTLSPLFGLRVALWIFIGIGLPMEISAAAHDVMVYSFVTAAGRKVAAPTAPRAARCLLIDTGVREIGSVGFESEPVDSTPMRRLVERALRVNAFQVRPEDSGAGDLIVVYHWGCAAPVAVDGSLRNPEMLNLDAMLAVIGGRALSDSLGLERTSILAAAREERYFVIVSAYSAGSDRVLLWRTHLTVPSLGLTQSRAMPILLGAGGALFGRDTRGMRHIAITVSGILNLDAIER